MPAIITGNAAKALPMITVNRTMPSANASRQPASSEERRLHLLPDREPQSWDDLMIKPRYLQALELALPR